MKGGCINMKKLLDRLVDKLTTLSMYYDGQFDDRKRNDKLAFIFGKVACNLSCIVHPYK